VRLHRIEPEFKGRVLVRRRAFPLELLRGEGPPRGLLEQEWWLAALQEPEAEFMPYPPDDWPTTTLPAFEAAWAAAQQGEEAGSDFDLRIRRAFFGQGRNIGRREVLTTLAREANLDMARFERDFADPEAERAVRQEATIGREQFQVHGTPTVMLGDGTRLHWPIAYPKIRHLKVVGVSPLPCWGAGCDEPTRDLFRRALSATAP